MVGFTGAQDGLLSCLSVRKKSVARRRKPLVDFLLHCSKNNSNQHQQEPCTQILTDSHLEALCNSGKLDIAIQRLSKLHTVPSYNTYLCFLQACSKRKAISHARHVVSHMSRHYLHKNTFLGDYAATALAQCGDIDDALKLFHSLSRRTVFSWTTIISVLVDTGRSLRAIEMYKQMQIDGVDPNHFTFVALLKACSNIPDLEWGRKLHDDICLRGIVWDVFIGNTLISMYGKCGAIVEAEAVFAELSESNAISWNAMLTGYVENHQDEKAILLFRQMHAEHLVPDHGTYMLSFQACCKLKHKEHLLEAGLEIGQALHADSWRNGFAADAFIGSALLSMYAKCGSVVNAENTFVTLPWYDVALWNTMLLVYVEARQAIDALRLFHEMHLQGIYPDQQTFTIVLQACGIVAESKEDGIHDSRMLSLKIVQALHSDVCVNTCPVDDVLSNTLLSIYGKCGAVAEVEYLFYESSQTDCISWNTIFSVYLDHGNPYKVLQHYKNMEHKQVFPDTVTLACVLRACSETASIEACQQIHFAMICESIENDSSLATNLIHAYGGCSSMNNAMSVFNGVPQPELQAWTACIDGYFREGNSVATFKIFDDLQYMGLDLDDIIFLPVLSCCSHCGLVKEGICCFLSMTNKYNLIPEDKHYATFIDLLARAGNFTRFKIPLEGIPVKPDLAVWSCLLSACRTHGNAELEGQAFQLASVQG